MHNDLTAQAIALALQGDVNGLSVLAPGPSHSRKDRSLSILLDPSAPDGFRVHSFANDDWKDCRDHVKARLGIPSGGYEPKPRAETSCKAADDAKRVSIALSLWNETEPQQGTLAERYLYKRNCVIEYMSDDLRFHPETWHKPTTRPQPAMIALMRDIRTNAPCGIHRTFLNADATKLDRMMLGRAKGACVKLTEDADVTSGLGIAEGIETALSVMRDGFRPMWACLSAGTIKDFPTLSGIQCLTVFADADHAGVEAAKACARRWLDAGSEVTAMHPAGGGDYNDRAKP